MWGIAADEQRRIHPATPGPLPGGAGHRRRNLDARTFVLEPR